MKRKLIFTLWVMLFLGFFSANCNAQASNNDQRIVGTWVYSVKEDGVEYSITYVFNANGSGTLASKFSGPPEESFNATFIFGISISGEIFISEIKSSDVRIKPSELEDYFPTKKIYFSPDGRTMFFDSPIGRLVLRKR